MAKEKKLISFKVLEFIEKKDKLHVIVETIFGVHTVRMQKAAKYLHIETKEPQWKYVVKEYLENKFKTVEIPKGTPEYDQYMGKIFKLAEIEDRSVEALHEKVLENRLILDEEKLRKKILHEESFKENMAELRAERVIINEARLKKKLEKEGLTL